MDFDQMLETWRAQNTAPPYDVDRDVLRQALQTEDARVRRVLRFRRRSLWCGWIVGTGMAVFAGSWIAISISNGWNSKPNVLRKTKHYGNSKSQRRSGSES